jgi:beta-lactamase class A
MPISRRALLGAAAAVTLAGCDSAAEPAGDPTTGRAPRTDATAAPPARVEDDGRLARLERRYDARLGIYAEHTGSGSTLTHRADERFAFCSTFKALATAAVLDRYPRSHLDDVVTYSADDLMASSVITERHVDTGMTVRRLCDAAVRHSDGTAGNLLLRDIGGPSRLTAFARSLGDTVTRMDRIEPHIVSARPGDPRDTSSPRALGGSFREIVLGDALPPGKRAFLRDLLERSTTGDERIRAGVPQDWTVASKTGTGDYATANDIAVVWPPGSSPLVVAIMSSRSTADAAYDEALIADAAALAVELLV